MIKKGFPIIHFYDQDFVDIYDRTWAWSQDFFKKGSAENGFESRYYNYPESETINQFEACLSTFFLVYSNRQFPTTPSVDNFYAKQEASGAIRGIYRESNGSPVFTDENPECVYPPLFALAEYNLFHKEGNKKRLRDIMPKLEAYFKWLESTFRQENGLYATPLSAAMMENSPREEALYLVDFNAQQALNALYMSAIGDILNDKELSFTYKRHYFSIKTRINSMMWDEEEGFYMDLDKSGNIIKKKTIAGFWTLWAEIPNEDKANALINHLKNPKTFGADNPFPTLALDESEFEEDGHACRGSVYPVFTFMVVKGLEKYARYELARECSIRHMYYILDALHPEGKKGAVYEAYKATKEGPSVLPGREDFPRPLFLPYTSLAAITLMIENVIGLYISLPRKTVDWIIPNLEIMGIEHLSLKRNLITILSNKSGRGWEIRLESEKLYYFTINVLGDHKKKTLPIPSGKCSMLIDKL